MEFVDYNSTSVQCKTNHFTSFAVLMQNFEVNKRLRQLLLKQNYQYLPYSDIIIIDITIDCIIFYQLKLIFDILIRAGLTIMQIVQPTVFNQPFTFKI